VGYIHGGHAVVGECSDSKTPTFFNKLNINHHLTRTLSDDPGLTPCLSPFLSLFSASQMSKGSQLDDLMSLKHRNPSSQASTGQSGGLRQSQMIF
jgi:hypothetical protein